VCCCVVRVVNSLGMQAHAAFASANGFTKTYRCRSVACHKPEMEAGGKSMLCFFDWCVFIVQTLFSN
jgi:hypothetical protein